MAKNKYGAVKTMIDGHMFDSKKEANHYLHLRDRLKKGQIKDLVLQPEFPLIIDGRPVRQRSDHYKNGRKIKYVADFMYHDVEKDQTIIIDVKGFDTDLSKLKRAVVEAIYNVRVDIV